MDILTRAEWGARPFARPREYVPITSRQYFVVHYPGAGTPPADVGDYAKWLERIHMDQNGWAGVGYNYFVSHGRVAEGCGRDVVGSHSPPHNRDGIGVNIWTSNGIPLPGDLNLARELYDQLCREAGHTLTPWWHGRDYATACPGPALRTWVQAGMQPSAGGSGPLPSSPEEDDMPLTPADHDAIAAAVWRHQLGRWAVPGARPDTTEPAGSLISRIERAGEMDYLQGRKIASEVGVDVDEAAIAKAVAEQLIPVVRESMVESGVADATADAVVAKLGSKLGG